MYSEYYALYYFNLAGNVPKKHGSKVEVPYTDISGFEFEMQIAHISPFLPVSGKTTQK